MSALGAQHDWEATTGTVTLTHFKGRSHVANSLILGNLKIESGF
jgi:hypothetical protein